jgi:hypothetical protein
VVGIPIELGWFIAGAFAMTLMLLLAYWADHERRR